MKGKVVLAGAGPGDPGLLTLAARRALEEADVIVYDALIHPAILAFGWRAKRIFVGKRGVESAAGFRKARLLRPRRGLAMTENKAGGLGKADRASESFERLWGAADQTLDAPSPSALQRKIEKLLIRLARQGKAVVRLKGGDPFLLGRGGEEVAALARARVPYEIIPGITSAVAAPAYAGIPLTDRRHASFCVIATGQAGKDSDFAPALDARAGVPWEKIPPGGTLVILMGVAALERIVPRLMGSERRWNRNTPAAAVEWGTWPNQRVLKTRLGRLVRDAKRFRLKPPAAIVIGGVASLGRNWWKPKPLAGRVVLVTRPAEQAAETARLLEEAGAIPVCLPAVEIRPESEGVLRRRLGPLGRFDWVCFTSQNAVEIVKNHFNGRWPTGVKAAAVGEKTAGAMRKAGIPVHLIGPGTTAGLGEKLARAIRKEDGERAAVLLPRADLATDELPNILRKNKIRVQEVTCYRIVRPGALRRQLRRIATLPVDWAVFTSASTVQNFFGSLKKSIWRRPGKGRFAKIGSIGPITSAALRRFGLKPDAEARKPALSALIRAMESRA